jgi:hypothetical protein
MEKNPSKWKDIPQFPRAHYEVDVSWDFVEWHLGKWRESYGLALDPDYQRAHVWTEAQQIAYVEYVLAGGEVGKNITWNCMGWGSLDRTGPMELIDGKQRLEAVRAFMRGDLEVYGRRYVDGDALRWSAGFKWRVCSLSTRADVLRLYLNINAGGTPHTPDEIERVRALLEHESGGCR